MRVRSWALTSTLATLILAGLARLPAQAEPPQVVVSIAPIHAIAAEVMAGIGEPRLLLEPGASEHSYALRPSDARLLAEANLIVRVDPALESFLTKPIEALGANGVVMTLTSLPGLILYPIRESSDFEPHRHQPEHDQADQEHAHEPEAEHDDHDHTNEDHADRADHAHGTLDMHIWLDPRNAAVIARGLAETLAERDPTNADAYRANAERFAADLAALEVDIAARLEPVRQRPFVVFHDAYRYFEARFGLAAVGSVTVSPGVQPGPRHLSALRAKIDKLGAVCVFSEPQFEPKLVATLTEGMAVRTGVLDPLGVGIEPGRGAYAALLRQMSDAFSSCLGG
jgi:zinc transport system substrate-binding protein